MCTIFKVHIFAKRETSFGANLIRITDMASYYVIKSYAAKQNFISRHSSELMWSQGNSKADVYTEADIIIKKMTSIYFK